MFEFFEKLKSANKRRGTGNVVKSHKRSAFLYNLKTRLDQNCFTKKTKKKIKNIFKTTVAVTSSFSIAFSSVTFSYAQSIVIQDPSAPGTTFLQTDSLIPQINIATPQSGVSLNQFTEFNVGADGLVLNNSNAPGASVSIIGANVTANPNLMVSGPANIIVNEVTSAAPSSLIGTTEVFGQSAAVIIANPNGISCNGCDFLNTTSTSLTTGVPTVNTNGDVSLSVEKGTITIGTGGFTSENNLGLYGRHVIINGEVKTINQGAVNTAIVSGGQQDVLFGAATPDQGTVTTHFQTGASIAPTSPFAIDASEAGKITSGNVTVLSIEADQGVNLYGDITATGTFNASSAGDLFYKNVTAGADVSILAANGGIRQYGDLNADGSVTIAGNSFTLYDGRIIQTTGDITINAAEYLVIAGEVSGGSIAIDISGGTLTNTGFILSDNDLTIVAGISVAQQRDIASEYDIYFDPALGQYLEAYQAQLLAGGTEADLAAEMIARAEAFELIAEYIDQGATMTGTNITVTAGQDITNTGGAIAATNDILLSAGNKIINEYLALRSRLNADDGCITEDCGYRTDFHAGEILAGNDLTLIATTGNIENRASDMAAANNLVLTAGQDVVNSLMYSNFEASETETVQIIGPGLVATTVCGKECITSYSVVDSEYSTDELHFNEENILSPGRIATLYGDIDITAGQDFVSIGSEISAGNDLTINAVGQAILSSYVDAEENFISRNERYANIACGKNTGYFCDLSQGFTNVVYDGTILATATSNLTGRSINITAGDNITLLGARFLAAVDLDLTSINGSVLIDSTDLPDEVELGYSAGVQFVELRDDVVAQIFGTVNFDDEIAGIGATYTNLLSDVTIAQDATDTLATEAADAILAEVVQAWHASYDPENPLDISTYLASLETDDVRRAALAQSLLYIVANTLGDEATALEDNPAAGLDEYALLQRLIFNGASDDALNTAALALVDALTASLLTQTQALETAAAAVVLADLPELTEDYFELRETTILNRLMANLTNATPSEVTEGTVSDFEALSIDDDFMRAVAINLANKFAVKMGRDPLFVLNADGEYENIDALIDIESDASLQRLVLELSLILSPGNAETNPTSDEIRAMIADGTSTESNILRIMDELADLSPVIANVVTKLINERDLKAKADAVLEQDKTGLVVDATLTGALIDQVATSLGTQALTERQAEVDANSSQYVQFLQGNELLTAVEGLRRATSGADIKALADDVGVQSYISLIDSNYLNGLEQDATDALENFHNTFVADIITLNNQISTYQEEFRSDLAALYATLDLGETEITAEIQIQIDALTIAYQVQLATFEADYQTQLAANDAQYGDLLTSTYQETYWTGGKYGYYATRWVTVTNTYYVDLKNTADAQALTDRNINNNNADLIKLSDEALIVASFTDVELYGEIDEITSVFNGRVETYVVDKADKIGDLETEIINVMQVADFVIQQRAIEDGIRNIAVQSGSVIEGERSLAMALTSQAFAGLSNIEDISVNGDGIVEYTYLDDTTTVTGALISGTKEDQDKFINATAWRFATDKALEQLSSTPRTVLLADNDLNIAAYDDVYVIGETMLAASNDLSINAGRRIGLLGAINTNFRLATGTRDGGYVEEQTVTETVASYFCGEGCLGKSGSGIPTVIYEDVEVTKDVWISDGTTEEYDVAYESFIEIGETLQLGTLMRDAYAVELVDGVEAIDGEVNWLNFAEDTQYYDLTSTTLSAGRDLILKSGGDILNFGGSLLSNEDMYIYAETDIRNETLRHNFTLTRELGCVGYACGRLGHEYRSAEFLSGSALVMSAGGDIVNKGSVIAAAGSVLADAEGDIVNEALSSQYLYHYINNGGLFTRRIEILNRAIISEAEITTEFGDITLNAVNNILNKGSKISAGGDVTLAAGNDILLEAKAEELRNYRKVRKFSGLSYGQTKTYWNEFDTAFSQIEGNNIYLDAGHDVTGIGVLLFAAQDIDIVAGEDITFDAHQNNRYEYTSGWSFGVSFGGSQIIEALIEGESLLDAYIATNPTLAAIHQLATADDRDGIINGVINLGYHLPSLLDGVSDRLDDALRDGRDLSPGKALAQELNPFDWLNDNGLFNPTGKNVQDDKRAVNKKGFLNGIKFRFGTFKSSREWTESYVSQLIAGEDLWLDAGKDLSLVGGTIASASENALLYAGENILVAALSDTTRTSSSGWGLSLGFGTTGLSFGVDFNRSTGQSELFTNAAVTAGGDLDIISGLDTVLMGANVKARDIYMDVGNDLIVQSRQNTSDSESFGFSFSTDGAFSLNISEAERRYTDTPTTIVAQDRLSIYTGSTTYLLGAVLQSEVGNLELDTGNLIFDNFNELDRTSSFGISGSISVADFDIANATNPDYINQSDVGGSWAYESTHAITYATVGAGTIRVRDVDDYDFSGLNRDVDHVQVITSHKKFVREIPGINLKRWNKQLERSIDLIEAYSTPLTDQIRAQGEHAVKLFRESVRQGFDPDELRALASSPEFRAAVRERKNFFEAVEHYGSVEAVPADTKAAIALGYTVLLGKASNFEGGSFVIPCQTSSQRCQIALDDFNLAFETLGADNILALLKRASIKRRGPGPAQVDLILSSTINNIVSILLWCATEYPDVFVQLTNNTAAKPLLEYYGAALGNDTNAFYNIADVISAGGTTDAIQVAYEDNVDWDVRTDLELTALNEEYAITTRAVGLLQSAFGASEAILGALGTGGCTAGSGGTGVALCTIGGYAIIIHGLDNASTGMDIFISGQGQQTIGAVQLQALGDALGLPQSVIDATILAYDIAGPIGVTGTVAFGRLSRTASVQNIVDTATNREIWSVVSSFRSADEIDGLIINGSYIKNPTARNLSDSVTSSGKIRINGQLANGQYMYVVEPNGNIVFGVRGKDPITGETLRMPHPTLIGGANPQVSAAGIVDIRGGRIYSVNNQSGHFQPNSSSLLDAADAFENLPSGSFHSFFEGFISFE